MLLREAMGRGWGSREGDARRRLLWEVPSLDEGGVLEDLDRLVEATLGTLPPVPRRPEVLPLPGSAHPWLGRIEGVIRALAPRRPVPGPTAEVPPHPGVLVIDGMEALASARRRLPDELLEIWSRLRDAGLVVHLVGSWRGRPSRAWREEGTEFALDLHPYRKAAWAGMPALQAEGDAPEVAFHRWLLLGQHPRGLPGALAWGARKGGAGEETGRTGGDPDAVASPDPSFGAAPPARPVPGVVVEEILARVLHPAGDLFDAPLRRLEAMVQAPARYARILQAMAMEGGEVGWGAVAERVGAEAGNRLAPYLRRLEADGWIRVHRPLDGREGGRRRRYVLADPFTAFWFGVVFPVRSLLHRVDPLTLWASHLEPGVSTLRARWLPVLARRWLRAHAAERLGAEAREVGGLWAEEVEVEVAARLTNGQVCYGLTHPGPGPATVEHLELLRGKMAEVRWGIGREVRAPLLFVAGPVSPELRRRVAGDPLAHLLTLADLMGPSPTPGPSSGTSFRTTGPPEPFSGGA